MLTLLAALALGQPLPAVTLRDAAGRPVTVAQVARPGRPVVLNFWASWCGPCRAELPVLLRAHQAKTITLLAVNVGESAETARRFLRAEGLNDLPLYFTDNATLGRLLVPGLPASFVLDAGGRLRRRVFGPVTDRTLPDLLRQGP